MPRPLIFIPAHNSEGKKDVTGAFRPEAVGLDEHYGSCAIYSIDNTLPMPKRRAQVLRWMEHEKGEFDSVVFFCHGWQDGIQLGFTRKTVGGLVKAISDNISAWDNLEGGEGPLIALYCCSTGEDPQDDPLEAAGTGDDSFADKLRDALCADGWVHCRVVAHTTAGHTTQNPNVLFMDGMDCADGGVGGYPPVSPKSKLWPKWKKALRTTDLRFRFPFMSPAEIHAELERMK